MTPEKPHYLPKLLTQLIYGDFSGDVPSDLDLALAARAELFQIFPALRAPEGSFESLREKLAEAQSQRHTP